MLEKILQKRQLLTRLLRSNQETIAAKQDSPSEVKKLEDPRPLIRELDVLLDRCNELITRHNDMVAALTENRRRCTEQVWQLFRWRLDGECSTLKQARAETTAQLENLQKEAT